VTTTSPVTIAIYIPAAAEPSHHIIDIFFFVFGFVGLSLLAILCIIMWLVFRIIGRRGKKNLEVKISLPIFCDFLFLFL
jgi:hypothetical protein